VLEYASDGQAVATGAPYTNRHISVLTIDQRKVTRWRDYLDPIAVFDALGWPAVHHRPHTYSRTQASSAKNSSCITPSIRTSPIL
jgi:hypothetical protein